MTSAQVREAAAWTDNMGIDKLGNAEFDLGFHVRCAGRAHNLLRSIHLCLLPRYPMSHT